uniref:Uncharacterized protein n=1 Tax=Medicago truncatula TaxID=3880 RepID=A2Q5S9_MEDTR|nr:hypothetical protein MtrDRAFT_AC169177g13v1 [Medicago truncatula]
MIRISPPYRATKVLRRYLWASTNYEHSTVTPTNYGHHIPHGSQPIMGTKRRQRASTNYEHSKGNNKPQPIMGTQDFGSQPIMSTTRQ